MAVEDFNRTINIWIKELEHYNFAQICAKPSLESWSLGQVIMHLIAETNFYVEQIKVCIYTNENSNEEATNKGKMMLLKNALPDEIIEGPASNALVPQAESKAQLLNSLEDLQNQCNEVNLMILKSSFHGKTRHPGLGYFNAAEWLQFAEMHFRHHLKQKERIDEFLKINTN